MRIRPATPADADILLDVIDLASEGLIPSLWSQFAPEGAEAADVGRAMVCAEEGPFSYASGHILEEDRTPAGGMICFPMTEAAAVPEPDLPAAFASINALEAQAIGFFYINMIAVLERAQDKGLGTKLLYHAEAQARAQGLKGVALIVAASNEGACQLYARLGFEEKARARFDLTAFGRIPTDAILMVKPS